MQKFNIVNENLVIKEATVLFNFSIPNNENKYLLYYTTDLISLEKNLIISRLVEEDDIIYIKDIKEKRFGNVKSYIDALISGNGGKKEIYINMDYLSFQKNTCQSITEEGRVVTCNTIEDIEYALSKLSNDFIDNFVYINEINEAIYNIILSKYTYDNMIQKKENIKGNINIFFLTLCAVLFLSLLIFIGYSEFINH